MMKRTSVLMVFLAMLLLVSTGGGFAQSGDNSGPELVVPLDGAEVFRVGSSISRVVTGQSDVVNVRVVNNREIILFGLTQGATTLHVWTDDGLVQRLLVVEQVSSQTVGNNFRSVLRDEEDLEDDVELRVFSPQHRGVSEFEEYIGELLGDDGEILLSDGPSRKIFVAGKPQLLDKISQLVDRLDVPGEDKVYSKRFVLENRAVTQIDTQVETMLSEDGQIVSDRETNSLLIVDEVSKVNSIQNYLRDIDVPTVAQVRIKTRFVEISDDFSQSLGIDWSASDASGSLKSRASFTDNGNDIDADDVPSVSGFELGLIDNAAGDFSIKSRLNALESESGLDLISSPSLVTRNQQEAVMEVLNEISYLEGCQVTQNESGSQATPQVGTIEDGITLSVTPLIGANDIVQLNIEPMLKLAGFSNRENIDNDSPCGPIEFPEVDRRTANLNVALKDGQTLVLGGLSRSEENPSYTRVPYLSQLPLMGNLFKNRSQSSEQKEINIFVTVDIIKFSDSSQMGDTVAKYPDEASREAQKTIESDTPLF